MTKAKLEQLRKAFTSILETYVDNGSWNIENVVSKLLYEVKIRVNNKESKN